MESVKLQLCAAPARIASRVWTLYDTGECVSDDSQYTLRRSSASRWHIESTDAIVAIAATLAEHPTTIFVGEWRVRGEGGEWRHDGMHFLHYELHTTPATPIPIDLLGRDFFLRHRATTVIWYVDPGGAVVHSGSKCMASGRGPGVRYCALCNESFSANNFVYQHVRKKHADHPVPGQSALEKLAELLAAEAAAARAAKPRRRLKRRRR